MLKRSPLFFLFLGLLIFSSFEEGLAQEASIIHAVNVSHVINNSKAWIAFRKTRNAEQVSLRERVRTLQNELQKENADLIKQQNILSREALIEKEANIRQKQRGYDQELNQTRQKIEKRQAQALDIMRKAIFDAVSKVAAKKKIDLVLNSDTNGAVIIFNQKLDLTQEILKIVNKELPELKIKG